MGAVEVIDTFCVCLGTSTDCVAGAFATLLDPVSAEITHFAAWLNVTVEPEMEQAFPRVLLVGSTENVTLWPESLVAPTSYVSPNFGFVGGVEVNVIWSPPGSVGPVGPVVGSVGPVVGSVGLEVVSVGAVDGGVDAGVTDGAALVGGGSVVLAASGPRDWPLCWPGLPSPPLVGRPDAVGVWVCTGGEPRSAASLLWKWVAP